MSREADTAELVLNLTNIEFKRGSSDMLVAFG
jgi:hypothetical protein